MKLLRWLSRIYSIIGYEIVRSDDYWWCYKCKDWTDDIQKSQDNGCDQGFSSHGKFKNKKEVFKEFDKLTLNGVDCCLCIWFFRLGKRYVAEWESKDQDCFNIKGAEND